MRESPGKTTKLPKIEIKRQKNGIQCKQSAD